MFCDASFLLHFNLNVIRMSKNVFWINIISLTIWRSRELGFVSNRASNIIMNYYVNDNIKLKGKIQSQLICVNRISRNCAIYKLKIVVWALSLDGVCRRSRPKSWKILICQPKLVKLTRFFILAEEKALSSWTRRKASSFSPPSSSLPVISAKNAVGSHDFLFFISPSRYPDVSNKVNYVRCTILPKGDSVPRDQVQSVRFSATSYFVLCDGREKKSWKVMIFCYPNAVDNLVISK